ncbi:Bug family tripartite tricarboxylate transporter substrate binding protein [Xylophilus sp.]|uniref:Bug family tripartite tricarboxylate transporter substrate binding protein n=1 Tax=Xylophilus sp. TaxID=2653893 RepID=UPI0013BB55BE|nr:tripartite tricarboxylate transporter substrate binding protein [Xylophilus sp.]KAF1046442.1 MAG: hypothetical protein GAK38_02509 [Xylophilus sp.]
MRFSRACMLGAALLLVRDLPAAAQDGYPQQPVRIVVAAPAGGGTDLMARIIGSTVGADAQWTVLVDNKPGANGIIGTDTVAKAKPDGYTLGMGQTATLAINPALFRSLPYQPLRDLVPIATVAEQPLVLVVHAESKFRSLADLVAVHKGRQLTLATAGDGTVGQMVGEMFGSLVGARFQSSPYKGSAPALQDVAGGQVDCMFAVPPGALPLIKGGRLRALAVTSAKRLPLLPDVPTVAESGYPGFHAAEWKVLVAPAGTSPAVVSRWNREVQKALAQPAVISRIIADGSLPLSLSQAETDRFVRGEHERWTAVVRSSGLSKSK